MARLFFLLSGEHEHLPFSELKAILEAEGYNYVVLEKLDQVARLEVDVSCVEAVKRRAALTRLCCLELFSCNAHMSSIVKNLRSTNFDKILGGKESFAVRVRRVREASSHIDLMSVERALGKLVLTMASEVHVDLENPKNTLFGVLTGGKFVFGARLSEIAPKPFVDRRPRKKPFFHPSAMQAKLARCMVNLAKPKKGDLVVDPFCGTGSMLVEAGLIGCRVLGIDVQRRMAKGTLKNLRHLNIDTEGVMLADALFPAYAKVDCIVTDPPYGISSSTQKRDTRYLVEELLRVAYGLLNCGRRLCIASPKKLNISDMGLALGYKAVESHFVYVHRSLTREIAVLEKVP